MLYSYIEISLCNVAVHANLDMPMCPFCDEIIKLPTKSEPEPCCENPNIDIDGHSQLCFNCGQVINEIFGNNFIDFNENKYKMTRKTIYNRKYHVKNVVGSISYKSGINIHQYDIAKIQRIFRIIDKYEKIRDDGRKRMISIKFIIRKILEMLGKPNEHIHLRNCKGTLEMYESIWDDLIERFADEIMAIIR